MDWLSIALRGAGALLIAGAATGLGSALWQAYQVRRWNRQIFAQWQREQRARLDRLAIASSASGTTTAAPALREGQGAWQGWRQFRVERIIAETPTARSIYLAPVDKKPLARFQAGQYLTIRWQLPGQDKPSVRCYSLSDIYNPATYRITVKQKPVDPQYAGRSVSHFFQAELMVGDILECKPPQGDFVLDPAAADAVVFLAAGVGITPLMSMIRSLTQEANERTLLLAYGNLNSESTIFRRDLQELQRSGKLHVLNCYSQPLPQDRRGVDYQVEGRLDVSVLQQVLPNRQFQFYLCGPESFMNGLYQGLIAWGVPPSRVHFEAFGPATITARSGSAGSVATATASPQAPVAHSPSRPSVSTSRGKTPSENKVVFHTAEGDVEAEAVLETILDLAEELHLELDYGCRSGNCGTCAVKLLRGQVQYPAGQEPAVPDGYCLACIAKPVGKVEVQT